MSFRLRSALAAAVVAGSPASAAVSEADWRADGVRELLQRASAFRAGRALAVLTPVPPAPEALPQIDETLRRSSYGVRWAIGSRYTAAELPALRAVLRDPARKGQWAAAVSLMGMIGDASSVGELVYIIESGGPGILPYLDIAPKTAAITSLGYIAHASKDPKALRYLADSVDPEAWNRRGLAWLRSRDDTYPDRNLALSRAAASALAYSGHPSAVPALRKWEKRQPNEFDRRSAARLFEIHDAVAQRGLAAYFEKR